MQSSDISSSGGSGFLTTVKNHQKELIIGIVILVVVAAAVVLGLVFGLSGDDDSDDDGGGLTCTDEVTGASVSPVHISDTDDTLVCPPPSNLSCTADKTTGGDPIDPVYNKDTGAWECPSTPPPPPDNGPPDDLTCVDATGGDPIDPVYNKDTGAWECPSTPPPPDNGPPDDLTCGGGATGGDPIDPVYNKDTGAWECPDTPPPDDGGGPPDGLTCVDARGEFKVDPVYNESKSIWECPAGYCSGLPLGQSVFCYASGDNGYQVRPNSCDPDTQEWSCPNGSRKLQYVPLGCYTAAPNEALQYVQWISDMHPLYLGDALVFHNYKYVSINAGGAGSYGGPNLLVDLDKLDKSDACVLKDDDIQEYAGKGNSQVSVYQRIYT